VGFYRGLMASLWEPDIENFIGFKCVFRHEKS
jgi:hypothetical protein